ncbi:MAG: amidase [Acidimicrobiia bacterium]
MRLEEYTEHDAVGLAALVRAGEVRPQELTALALEAADRVDPALRGFVEVYPDAADRALAAAGAGSTAPLAGVPMVRKDIGAPEAGKATELGSRLAEGLTTHRDSYLTTGFKQAGLVIIGRSATSEFGCYGTIETALRGRTHSPWSPAHTSGGSSGGSAALVAAGVVPVGHANDGAGSIRIPASCCGLVGLKPSRGRVSAGPGAAEPNFGGSVQLVVTRSVRDTAAVLDAVGGPRPGDPFVIAQPERPFARVVADTAAETAAGVSPAPTRIAWTVAPWGPTTVDAEVAAAVRAAAVALDGLGLRVAEEAFPFDAELFEPAFIDLWAIGVAGPIAGIAERMGRPLTAEFLEPVTLAWLEHCRTLSATDITHALDDVNRLTRRSGAFFERFDVLVTPTLAGPPVPFGVVDGLHEDMDAAGNARAMLDWNPYCPLFNLTGQPAITVPLAQSGGGLPLGVQLVGRPGEEALLLALAAQLEVALPWASRRPPVHAAAPPVGSAARG